MPAEKHCSDCDLRTRCIWRDHPNGPAIAVTARIFRNDESLFAANEPCDGLLVVRAGVIKSYTISASGDEQVQGFYYPGDVVGLEGLSVGVHLSHGVSVGTSSVCAIAKKSILGNSNDPDMLSTLLRLLGDCAAQGTRNQLYLGTASAEQRIAAFLLETSRRYERNGYSGTDIRLPMRRMDIAGYLSLAVETVSRTFRKLEHAGVISVDPQDRHHIKIQSSAALAARGEPDDEVCGDKPYPRAA